MSYAEELSIKVTAQDEASARLKDVKKQLRDLEQQQKEASRRLYETGAKEAKADVDRLAKSIKDLRDEQKRTAAEAAKLNREIAKLSTTRLQRTGDWLVKHQKDIQRTGIVAGAAMALLAKTSLDAYADAEKYQSQLNTAYEKFPALADVSIDRMRTLNTELMNLTGADDDALAGAEALLARFNLTGSEIERLIPLVNDYSIATGKDLTDSATVVGKSLLGNARALKDLGIDYKATGDRAQDLISITAALQEKVGGAGAAFRATTAGDLKVARESFSNLQEEIGAALVPALEAAVNVGRPVLAMFQAIPKPVQQAAFVVAGLGVAAMIAFPKILLLKRAMTDAGISGGTLAKKAGGAAIGIGAVTTAIGFFVTAQQNAQAAAEGLVATFDRVTGAATTATRQKIGEEFLRNFSPDDLAKTPFKLEEIITAATEGGAAMDALRGRVKAWIDEQSAWDRQSYSGQGRLMDALKNSIDAADRDASAARALAAATRQAGDAAGDTAVKVRALEDPLADYEDYLTDTGTAAQDAATRIDRLTRATSRLLGVVDRIQAIRNFRKLLREAQGKPGKEATEAALAGQAAVLGTFPEKSRGAAEYTLRTYEDLVALVKGAGYGKAQTSALLSTLQAQKTAAEQLLTSLNLLDDKKVNVDVTLTTLQNVINGQRRKKKALGGYVAGPGTGTSDSIPAMLSNGEYVIRAAAVDRIGLASLDRLNYADRGPLPVNVAAAPITLAAPAGRDAPLVGVLNIQQNSPLDVQRELAHLDRQRQRQQRSRTGTARR